MPITDKMFRPGRMDIVPITLEDLTDVPLHYCEFFVTALHKFLIKLNTPASSIALRKVVLSFMRVIYDVQAKFTERQSRMEGNKTMLQYRDRFIWKDQKIDLDLLNSDRRLLLETHGKLIYQAAEGRAQSTDVLIILFDNYLVIAYEQFRFLVDFDDPLVLQQPPIAYNLITSISEEYDPNDRSLFEGLSPLTIRHQTASKEFDGTTILIEWSVRKQITIILESISNNSWDQCEVEFPVGDVCFNVIKHWSLA